MYRLHTIRTSFLPGDIMDYSINTTLNSKIDLPLPKKDGKRILFHLFIYINILHHGKNRVFEPKFCLIKKCEFIVKVRINLFISIINRYVGENGSYHFRNGPTQLHPMHLYSSYLFSAPPIILPTPSLYLFSLTLFPFFHSLSQYSR